MKPYYTYILWSESIQKFYIGATSDLNKRILQHNRGYENFTSKGKPWKLIWHCTKPSRKEAFDLERKLKNLKSQQRIRDFIAKYSYLFN